MRVQMIALDRLDARPDARPVDDDKVRALVTSIGDLGLINPVRVRPSPGAGRDGRFEVVAGMHRVAAYFALGLVEIEAHVVDAGDLFAELAMIDENLCRSELTAAQLARQVARRKQIYEELHPETRHGTPGVSRQVGDTRERSEAERFTTDTAHATGRSERSVQRDAERGQRITDEALDAVEGTALDTGAFLDRLKRVEPAHQAEVVAEELERRNPNAHRATMHRRVEPDDSLNYFPTPPWATRALMEVLLPTLGLVPAGARMGLMWDPACGEGHISGVLAEYAEHGLVAASDIFDYSLDGVSPPGWMWAKDFLADDLGNDPTSGANWIITNPPFGAVTLPFVLKALRLARIGVAMLVRQQWLEGVSRYRELFEIHPPALIGQFVERVPILKGRWDPDGDTLTSYVWIVWVKAPGVTLANGDTRFCWIPDGQREALTRPDDIKRFTARPCRGPNTNLPDIPESSAAPDEPARAEAALACALSPQPDSEAEYRAALAANADRVGRFTMAEAAPVLSAGRAAGQTPVQLASALGHPVGTIKAWLNRLGLTSPERLAATQAAFVAAYAQKPGEHGGAR